MVEANLKGRGAVRRAVDGDPREVLADLGVRPRRRMGQHFLIDARVAARQVAHAQIRPSDVVLEIGPGLGVLTRLLAERAKRVIAIESDRRFAPYLRRRLPQVEVIQGDALRVDWPRFDVMTSNLPYQISSPLTFRLLDHAFDRAVLMYQWEFARRMRASPGTADYSRLTVGVYRRAACEILERVPRNAFYPQPRVDSALVSLVPRPAPFPLRTRGGSTRSSTPSSPTDARRSRMGCGSDGRPSPDPARSSKPSSQASRTAPVASGNCPPRRSRGSRRPYRWRKVNGTSPNRYRPLRPRVTRWSGRRLLLSWNRRRSNSRA